MRYKIFLIFFTILVVGPATASAQDTRYRVELLVLTHLGSEEEPREVSNLSDYSAALDFLTPAGDEDAEEEAQEDEEVTEADGQTGIAETPESLTDEEEPALEEDPNRVVHVEQMSAVMEEAWRRLRLSAPFRPEQYLSWEQGSEEPFPVLRVHDLETVLVNDPWAEQRAAPAEREIVFTDTPDPVAQNAGEDMEGPPLPEPVYHYRLDGTAALIRSRFLHLELDLQLSEAVFTPQAAGFPPVEAGNEADESQPVAFRVHTMNQSRQVRTGRMEYFDGPVLGVLAYITEIEPSDEETP